MGNGRFDGSSRVVREVKGRLVDDNPWRVKGRSRRIAASENSFDSPSPTAGLLSSVASGFLLSLMRLLLSSDAPLAGPARG